MLTRVLGRLIKSPESEKLLCLGAASECRALVALYEASEYPVIKDALSYMCRAGVHPSAAWHPRLTGDVLHSCFKEACRAGHLRLAQRLAARGLSPREVGLCGAVSSACRAGSVPLVSWLIDTYEPGRPKLHGYNCVLLAACKSGSCELLQWLHARHALSDQDVVTPEDGSRLLVAACKRRHLDAARLVTDLFALKKKHVLAYNSLALREACCNGHLDVVCWLVTRFELRHHDFNRWSRISKWGRSRGSGRKRLVRPRDVCDDPLSLACRQGHLHVVQWLVTHLEISWTDINNFDINPLLIAYDNGQVSVLRWLVEWFSLDSDDIPWESGTQLRKRAVAADWLECHFGPPSP